jgi:heat shock protein HslJ
MKHLLLALALLTSACATSNTPRDDWPSVVGREWNVTDLEAAPATVTFDDQGRATGEALNAYFTSYERSGGELTLGTLGSTRMAGPADAMDREQEYFRRLEQVTGWRLHRGQLELLGGDEVVLTYRR